MVLLPTVDDGDMFVTLLLADVVFGAEVVMVTISVLVATNAGVVTVDDEVGSLLLVRVSNVRSAAHLSW